MFGFRNIDGVRRSGRVRNSVIGKSGKRCECELSVVKKNGVYYVEKVWAYGEYGEGRAG